jgi:Ni,Fe-hydrogenase III small subunit
MNRKPIGISVPYRKPQPKTTLAALEKAVKDLTQRVQQLELKLKEKSK